MPRPYVTLAEHPTDMVRLAAPNAKAAGSIAPRPWDSGKHGTSNHGPSWRIYGHGVCRAASAQILKSPVNWFTLQIDSAPLLFPSSFISFIGGECHGQQR
jgi:hypothetical protein